MLNENQEINLKDVIITYGIYSSDVGGGRQEIHIRGDLIVKLYYTKHYQSEPKIAEAPIREDVLLRLLEMFEQEKFDMMEQEIVEIQMAELRILKLTRLGNVYTVERRGAVDADFERLVGAVKLAAAIAHPAVTQGSFFPSVY